MRSSIYLLLAVLILVINQEMCGNPVSIKTGIPGVACSVRPLTIHELEWLFLKTKRYAIQEILINTVSLNQDTAPDDQALQSV